ncbi:MAG: rhodanese-like domain-containing protein [Bdellovibrionaceae bacterium]|nr:rhodanese-like domain-containing protein [Bdellovibrio sp.]
MSYKFTTQTPNPNFPNVTDVPPQEVNEHQTELTLIDVRENVEYTGELGHIKGTQLVVLSSIPQNLNSIPKEKPIVFICRSGGRSAQAASFAKQQGFDTVYNMAGGMLLWNQLQLPTEK